MLVGILKRAAEQYERTLKLDAEDLDAHYGLAQCYARLGEALPPGKALDESGPCGLPAISVAHYGEQNGDAGESQRRRDIGVEWISLCRLTGAAFPTSPRSPVTLR